MFLKSTALFDGGKFSVTDFILLSAEPDFQVFAEQAENTNMVVWT